MRPRITSSNAVSPSSGTRRRTAPRSSGTPRKPRSKPCLALNALTSSAVALGALRLEDRALVPVEPEPAQRVDDLLDVLRGGALAIGIFDPQHEHARLPV